MRKKLLRFLSNRFPEWQKYRLLNCGSPSSQGHTVLRIEKEFLADTSQRRILDVGGTKNGFVKLASPEMLACTTIVNPADSWAKYARLKDVPPDAKYDLIMMFGVLGELEPDYNVEANFRDARARLAPDGTFLIAEPDHKSVDEHECLSALLAAGFSFEGIRRRNDLRPGFSYTKYFIFTARV